MKKFYVLAAFGLFIIMSCSKSEENNNNPYIGYYNSKSVYSNDLLLKITTNKESISYYGTTNGGNIDLLTSLYKDNATGRRTIYKTNATADTAIVYNFDKPEFGGILFIKKNSKILVQEFEFGADKKTIKPSLYLTTIQIPLNRLSQSNNKSSEDDSTFMDNEINKSGAWFMTAGLSEIIKGVGESITSFKEERKESLDDLFKMPETIKNYIKDKFNKNPELIQEPVSKDPKPTPEPVEPLPNYSFVDCNNVKNGNAYIDSWCNKCVQGNTGLPRCGPAIDCSGEVGGNAYKDGCDKCVGGNTGNIACVVIEDCSTTTLSVAASAISINSATAIATGGKLPYAYTWSNGVIGDKITSLIDGKYTVTVTDALGCSKKSNEIVIQSCDLNTIIGNWNVEMYNTCYPNSDGTPAYYVTCSLTLYQDGQSVFTYNDGSKYTGTYTYNDDCTFSYNNIGWCGVSTVYPPSSKYYKRFYDCGCLSLKHIKQ